MTTRIPKIYLSAPVNSSIVLEWKNSIMEFNYVQKVDFLDPARHKLNSFTDSKEIAQVNNEDMNNADAACFYYPNRITAGTSIELSVCKSILRIPVMVFTLIPRKYITPYVLNLSGVLHAPYGATIIIRKWLKGWYERTNSGISG